MRKGLGLIAALAWLLLASSAQAATSGTFSADGTATVTSQGYNASGMANTLYLSGTWGSGTVTLEASPDNGTTWVAVSGYSWTANTLVNIAFRWTKIRVKLSGSTSPTLNWWVL